MMTIEPLPQQPLTTDAFQDLEQRVDIVNRQLNVLRRRRGGSKKIFNRIKDEIRALTADFDAVQSTAVYFLFLLPFAGFFGYPAVSSALRDTFEAFVSFKSVDGNAFAAELLRLAH